MRRLIVLAVGLATLEVAMAAGPLSTAQAQQVEALQEQEHEVEEEEFHKNTLSLFLGGATNTEIDRTGFAIGADYERRLSQLWGVGLLAELTIGGERPRDFVLAVPVSLHPYRGWRLVLAPGFEIKPPVPSEGVEAAESEETELEGLVRLGVSYEFEVGRYTIAPEFDVDFVKFEEIVLVYGIAFGIGF